jgi:hypothetical protein
VRDRTELEDAITQWKKEDVERVAEQGAFAAYALRTEEEWDALEQVGRGLVRREVLTAGQDARAVPCRGGQAFRELRNDFASLRFGFS